MTKDIVGIIDFDFISTKEFCNYNFGVLLVSSYYLEQGLKVRLIIDLTYENLSKYNKIYIFKDYKTKIKPINLIKNYYLLPVEEYGEGFENKPLFPDLPNLIYTQVKTDIYQPILTYLKQGGKAFKLNSKWKENYFPSKIFFYSDKELLLREEPRPGRLLVYDNPLIFFTSSLGQAKLTEMLKKSIIKFVKPIHITQIPKEYWNLIFSSKRFVGIVDALYAYEDDEVLIDFVKWSIDNTTIKRLTVAIKTAEGVKWFKKRGGKIYGNYRSNQFTRDVQKGLRNNITKENISTWYDGSSTKRFVKNNRPNRKRINQKERSKYLPSEYQRRYRENKNFRKRKDEYR